MIEDERFKKKYDEIQKGINKTKEVKELLFSLKSFFYGDFKWDEGLKKPPDPNRQIQKAIVCLEQTIREAMKIKINSI